LPLPVSEPNRKIAIAAIRNPIARGASDEKKHPREPAFEDSDPEARVPEFRRGVADTG
jgi:hypothetical protein